MATMEKYPNQSQQCSTYPARYPCGSRSCSWAPAIARCSPNVSSATSSSSRLRIRPATVVRLCLSFCLPHSCLSLRVSAQFIVPCFTWCLFEVEKVQRNLASCFLEFLQIYITCTQVICVFRNSIKLQFNITWYKIGALVPMNSFVINRQLFWALEPPTYEGLKYPVHRRRPRTVKVM